MTNLRTGLDAVPRGAKLLGVTLAIVFAAAALVAATSARDNLTPAAAVEVPVSAEVVEGRFGEPLVQVSLTNPSTVTTSYLVEWTLAEAEAGATPVSGHTIIGDVSPGEQAEEVVDAPRDVSLADAVTVVSVTGEALEPTQDDVDVVVADSGPTTNGRELTLTLTSHNEHPTNVRVRLGFYDAAGVRYASTALTLSDVAPMTTSQQDVQVLGDHHRFASVRPLAEAANR